MKTNWPTRKISECIQKLPKKLGIPLKQYQEIGRFPVIDQGRDCIGGYTNNSELIYKNVLPVIIFGDHTRLIKFIDFPFAVGADGTKVLKPKDFFNARYFYFALMNLNIKSRGYARHFSILKEKEIFIPPLTEQKRIVAKLEKLLAKINEAKRLRAEALEATEKLLPAELHKIFKEGKQRGWPEKELGNIFVLNYGKNLPKAERRENGKYIAYGANGELSRSNKFLTEGKGIIIGRKGSAGKITRVSGRYWPTDVTYFVKEDKKYDIDFVYYLFEYLNLPQYAVGVKPGINRNLIYSIKFFFPPIDEQKRIVGRLDAVAEKVGKLKKYQLQTATDLDALSGSILHQALGGIK